MHQLPDLARLDLCLKHELLTAQLAQRVIKRLGHLVDFRPQA